MRELKQQLISALLVILTVAAIVCTGINFQQQKQFRLPEDGVTWIESTAGGPARALHVVPEGAAERAGIKTGDVLKKINTVPIANSLDVTRVLVSLGAWKTADYILERGGIEIKAKVIIRERVPDVDRYYQYAVGVVYLAIGIFVYFRRGNAPKALHFYALCLASFILSTFHYTGKLNEFDKVIYWGNVAAGLLAPTVFLHFSLNFPQPRSWVRGPLRTMCLYTPAGVVMLLYLGLASGTLRVTAVPLIELRWLLDRVWMVYLSLAYLSGAWALSRSYRRERDPIVRQQLKWLRNGAAFGVMPFTAIYVLPYLMGVIPGPYLGLAVFSLLLIPVTWAYAILRYRLMDVDVIFQQGYAYTLATLAVLGIFYGMVVSISSFDELSPSAMTVLLLIATLIFQPIRNWIQAQLDRYYFKERYDYRRTLLEFGRELATETDLDAMLHATAERLLRTLPVAHIAFFLAEETGENFHLRLHEGNIHRALTQAPDLSFLRSTMVKPLFLEQTRRILDVIHKEWPASVRQTIAELDLTYYLPCMVRGRTIAFLGVSRTTNGDFLSSDDLELLVTLSGSIGIAVENARLYQSLQRKMEEYERLKEFSENIVESINVGILAADLEDRVESWNTQMERLTGIPRDQATRRRMVEIFPAGLIARFDLVRGENGIHHIYKFPLRAQDMPYTATGPDSNGHTPGEVRPQRREATLNIAIAPLVTREGDQIGRLIIFDDITERSELESRLLQADKLSSIGLLAAGVAHEVNTPLAVISTYAQMLAKQVSEDEQKSRLLDKIARQTFRASEIVNSLLNFSRTSPTEFEELDLHRVIRETLTLIEHQLRQARIQVTLRLADGLPPVRGNFGKMQQVFLNLFLNARDAMEDGGDLVISTSGDRLLACVEIADSGKGIAAEHLPRIYDPFFTTKGVRKGTGLGLSVTYGIVREHGGTIEVSSQPGAGTRFQLQFPAARKLAHV